MTRTLPLLRYFACAVVLCLVQQSAALSATAVSPGQCFQSFNTSVHSAKKLDSVEQYFSKPLRLAYKKYSPAQRQAKLKELKEYYIPRFRIYEEKASGVKEKSTATITAKGRTLVPDKKKRKKAMVQSDFMTYVKEGHYWRISGARFSRSKSWK
jgi:hypothetical protein